jgi:hypothetical protein
MDTEATEIILVLVVVIYEQNILVIANIIL